MKVCLLNDSFPPVIDGVVNVVLNYAGYLREDCQSEVIVGCPRYPDADYDRYDYPVVPYQSFNTSAITNGYRTGNPFVGKAVQELARFAPDIIHTHCPASATLIARMLREETGAPVIFTYHTKYDIDIRRAVKLESVAREGIRIMVGNIEACDEVWVVSCGAGESLKALGFSGDYRVMSNGVDFARGRVLEEDVQRITGGADLPAGVPVFLFVGRMMNYKGLPLLLEALKLLQETGQDYRMVMIGKGPDEQQLKDYANQHGLKCLFTGPIYDRDELRAWNTRADLFLFPSTFDTNGLVVREAAACGLASVLIKNSCAAEGITDGRNGFLIDETPEAMAKKLEELCRNMELVKKAGEHAMNEIYLSWQTCVHRAYDRYQEVLEEKKAGRLGTRVLQPSDYLLSLTAKGMSEQEKLRQFWAETIHDARESAVGMMENIQEAGEGAEHLRERMKEQLKEGARKWWDKIR